jgi:hypothetical protein
MAGVGDQQVVVSLHQLKELLKEAINESEIEPKVVAIVQKKFEMTLGVTDCTNPVVREATRKDMEFTRDLRLRGDVEENLNFIKDFREKLKKAVDRVSATLVWSVVVAVLSLLGVIIKNPSLVDEVLKHK